MSLAGKTIVFTGAISLARAEATKKAEAAGAKVASSLTAAVNLVVAGPGAESNSKFAAAKAKGITIWTEQQFVDAASAGAKGQPAAAKPAAKAPAPKKAPAKKAAARGANVKKRARSESDDDGDSASSDAAPPARAGGGAAAGAPKAKPLAGKTVCFTGTLATMKRADAQALATKAGATVAGSITAKVNLVVAGADAGSKLDAARAKGVAIISEAAFKAQATGDSAAAAAPKKQKARTEDSDENDEGNPLRAHGIIRPSSVAPLTSNTEEHPQRQHTSRGNAADRTE